MLSHLGLQITKAINKETKKKEGIYFTPLNIVDCCYKLLSKYIDKNKEITICEPSCGSLEFINNDNIKQFNLKNITCYELNKEIFEMITKEEAKQETKHTYDITIFNEDYLKSSIEMKYDLIIGNPPYFITKNKLYNDYYTGRPNIYIQFIIHSLFKLNPNGILCFVIPMTLLSSQYYELTRKHIIENFKILEIVINNDKFKETNYNTFILIVQNTKNINETENKKYIFKNTLTPYKNYFKELLQKKHFYLKSVGNILNGWFVWNQHKDILTDKDNKKHNRCILYYANENKQHYIKHYKGNKILNDVIVFYRGNGNNSFKWKPRIIRYKGNGIVIENHLLYLVLSDDYDIKELFKYINNDNTKIYVEKFITSGAITTKTLMNDIPIFKE